MARNVRVDHPKSLLLERTKELLCTTDKSYYEIFMATGISPHWLSFFKNNKHLDPSVNRVECLYTYLSGTPLVIG